MIHLLNYLKTKGQAGTDNVIIMTSSTRTCTTLREYLSQLDPAEPRGTQGRRMLMNRFRGYLNWKAYLQKMEKSSKTSTLPKPGTRSTVEKNQTTLNEALAKKDKERMERTMKRRRIRGGFTGTTSRAHPLAEDVASRIDTGDPMLPEEGFVPRLLSETA